jgi:hypothetical protein
VSASDILQLVSIVLGCILIPLAGYYVKRTADREQELVDLRLKILSVEKDIAAINSNCQRHQAWMEATSNTQQRMDRNIARLCQKGGVDYEEA